MLFSVKMNMYIDFPLVYHEHAVSLGVHKHIDPDKRILYAKNPIIYIKIFITFILCIYFA